jgi:hypothetical protein
VRVRDPREWGLPSFGVNQDLLLGLGDSYFVYPTDFHKYAERFRDNFIHGGISLEEMALPVAVLRGRGRG